MTRQFCDRCGADVTGRRWASVHVVADADAQGNGKVTTEGDLCPACYRLLVAWLKPAQRGTSLAIRRKAS